MNDVMTTIEGILRKEMMLETTYFVELEAGTLEETGYSPERIHEGVQRLVDSGRWDYLPAIGMQGEVFFNIPALLDELPTVTESTREMAAASIAAWESFRQRSDWTQLSGSRRQDVVDVSIRCNPFIIESIMKQNNQKLSIHSVNSVSIALSSYYLANAGFAVLSHRQLAVMTRCSKKAIREAIKALVQTGLWGVIRGTGTNNSRFFPLFTDAGFRAFDLALSN